MGKLCFFLLSVVLLVFLLNGETATASSRKKVATGARTHDGSEEWGYVEVRPSKQTVSVFILLHICVISKMCPSWFVLSRSTHVLVAL